MSNYLAIATVTTALRNVVYDVVKDVVNGAMATTLRPEKAGNGNQSQAGVNLYLYQVTPNAAWRNRDIVFRQPIRQTPPPDDRGKDTVQVRAQIPLNLHYLFSFYGDEGKLEPQLLLGSVVSAIETQAILSLDTIRTAIRNNVSLAKSDLAFQVEFVEHIRLSPLALSLEELSKLWSVFFQVPYALSVAYEASVVLIEPGLPRTIKVVTDQNIDIQPEVPLA
jgi:hypothetical protein